MYFIKQKIIYNGFFFFQNVDLLSTNTKKFDLIEINFLFASMSNNEMLFY